MIDRLYSTVQLCAQVELEKAWGFHVDSYKYEKNILMRENYTKSSICESII